MKIFNWVHRRFNNKEENVKKNDDVPAEDQQFPDENKCNDIYGILAIGTFGYDPLKDEEIKDYSYDEEIQQLNQCDEDSDEEEKNPLVLGGCSDNAEDDLGLTEAEKEENWSPEFEYVMMKKKERTTLADLFYSDPQHEDEEVVVKKMRELVKEKSNRKQTLWFGKKMMGKDARPIHKLNQLMRRMMKRKIHPDTGAGAGPINSKCRATDDYASLLSTQDGK